MLNFRQQQDRENEMFFSHSGRIVQKCKVDGASDRTVDFGSFYAPLTINALLSTSSTRDTKVVKAFALLSIRYGFFWDLEKSIQPWIRFPVVYLAKLWQTTITQWPSNTNYCFKQHLVDSFICFKGWISVLIFSDYNDIINTIRYSSTFQPARRYALVRMRKSCGSDDKHGADACGWQNPVLLL